MKQSIGDILYFFGMMLAGSVAVALGIVILFGGLIYAARRGAEAAKHPKDSAETTKDGKHLIRWEREEP